MDPQWEAHPLTANQAVSIDRAVRAGENSQLAIYAGFRCIAGYIASFGDEENTNYGLDGSDCNDISWILKHLVEELEAISTTINSLNHRYHLAYKYSAGKK